MAEGMQGGMRGGGKFETYIYARRPDKEPDARWIVTLARTSLEDYMIRGFEPLWKYGRPNRKGDANKWVAILSHPDGAKEFPVEQVMQFRWYRDEDNPLPGTKYPQLVGHKVKEYKCPECRRIFPAFDGLGGIEDLGRHLKIIHSWDRASLVRYGEKVGIDFDAIYSNIEKTYEFDGSAVGKAPEEAPEEPGIETVGEFDCDECDWKPKPDAKRPGFALMSHKRGAHPVAVPA